MKAPTHHYKPCWVFCIFLLYLIILCTFCKIVTAYNAYTQLLMVLFHLTCLLFHSKSEMLE